MKVIAFILLLFSCSSGFAQKQPQIDSLKNLLAIEKQDTNRIFIMCRLASLYQQMSIDSGFYYSQHALALARQVTYRKGEAEALDQLAYTFHLAGNPAKATEVFLSCLKISDKNNIHLRRASSILMLGIIFKQELKDNTKALNYLYRAKALFDSIHENKFATASAFERRYAAAYFTTCENVIGGIYTDRNQLDSAQHYLQLSYQDLGRFDIDNFIGPYTMDNLGLFFKAKGENENALGYFKQGVALTAKSENFEISSLLNYHIAQIYQQENQLDSAIYFAQNGLNDARQGNFFKNQIETGAMLSGLFKYKDAGKAMEYSEIASAAKDSLYSLGKKYGLISVLGFDEQERQYEIETSQTALKNQVRQNVLFVGLGVILLIAFILYRNSRQKQKANKVLEKTLTDLKLTQSQLIQSEKMASLGELTAGIAHEIQNPLNFVNNFSEVNKELISEMREEIVKGNYNEVNALAKDVEENQEKINHHGKRAEAIVKGMLQHSRSNSGVKEPTDINTLCDEYLRLAYHGLRAKDSSFNVRTETDFDNSIGNINVVPQDMGRVILNLISNAFYAVDEKKKKFANEYEPTISVSTKKLNGKLEIKVSDNGNGIPQKILDKIFQPFFTTKPTGQGTGLGLSLSYDIVKAHGGEIKVNTKENEGTEFTIILPA